MMHTIFARNPLLTKSKQISLFSSGKKGGVSGPVRVKVRKNHVGSVLDAHARGGLKLGLPRARRDRSFLRQERDVFLNNSKRGDLTVRVEATRSS